MQSESGSQKQGGYLNFLLLAVGLGFLAWTLSNNWSVLSDVFSRRIQYQYLIIGFLLVNAAAFTTFLRWYYLVRMLGVSFKLVDSLRLSYVGMFFNLVIPGAVGGDLVKAAYLSKMDLPKTQAITTLLVDRIVGLIGIFYLAAAATLANWNSLSQPVRNLGLFALLMALSGSAGLFVILMNLPARLFPGLAHSEGKVGILIRELGALSRSYKSRWKALVATVFVSILCHTLACAACYCVGLALFPDFAVSLGKHLMIFPLVLFSTAVPLPFGALGFSEGVSDQLFQFVGHPSGAVAMMGYRVLMYGVGMVSMSIYLWNIKSIRELTQQSRNLTEDVKHELQEQNEKSG